MKNGTRGIQRCQADWRPTEVVIRKKNRMNQSLPNVLTQAKTPSVSDTEFLNIDAKGKEYRYATEAIALQMSHRLPFAWKAVAMEVPRSAPVSERT